MPTNTSATGGYLDGVTDTLQVDDDDFENLLHDLVMGLSAIPQDLVRPRWQATPLTQPTRTTNWCALGITNRSVLETPVITHDPAGDGSDHLVQQEELDLLVSFYGPNSSGNASRLRDGLYISQNRDVLTANSIGLVRTSSITPFPELVGTQWYHRHDITITLRRKVQRTYAVLTLRSAQGEVDSDKGETVPYSVEFSQ